MELAKMQWKGFSYGIHKPRHDHQSQDQVQAERR